MEWVLRSFEQVLYDPRVSEIVISDDASDPEIYRQLENAVGGMDKVKLFRNERNMGVYVNKKISVELATNEYACVWDSDNIYGIDYIDKLFQYQYMWDENILYSPDFAKPIFDFTQYSGWTFSKENISKFVSNPTNYPKLETLLNLMNFFVNRKSFLDCWDGGHEPIGSDSIYQNFNWLKSGRKIVVLGGLEYEHVIHDGSHYRNNAIVSTPMVYDVVEKLKRLS